MRAHKRRQRQRKQERKVDRVGASLVGLSQITMCDVQTVPLDWTRMHPSLCPDAHTPSLFENCTGDFDTYFLAAQAHARQTRLAKKKKKQAEDGKEMSISTPLETDLGLLHVDRARRKQLQVESFAHLLGTLDAQIVVEFGCGSGNMSLPLATHFPTKRFILLDMKPMCVELARVRAELAQLRNVEFRIGKIEDADFPFDVGLALHVCGAATDYAMDQCLRAGAAFIVSPCCIGKLKQGSVSYPRSSWLRDQFTQEQYVLEVASVADHSETCNENGAHRTAKLVIEKDRKCWAEERGYSCDFFQMPMNAGPKRDIIVGRMHLRKECAEIW